LPGKPPCLPETAVEYSKGYNSGKRTACMRKR
jgi:hypothetical protein